MKKLLLTYSIALVSLILSLTGCGKPQDAAQEVAPTVVTTTSSGPDCTIVDECTYVQNVFGKKAEYNCVETTYNESEHPEIPSSDFQGKTCIITREDYEVIQTICQFENSSYPCEKTVQGPGPVANP
jgi:hypothetical protein